MTCSLTDSKYNMLCHTYIGGSSSIGIGGEKKIQSLFDIQSFPQGKNDDHTLKMLANAARRSVQQP